MGNIEERKMVRDQYWLDICEVIASNSKCLSRKLGALIVKDNGFIVSTGYNGPPAKCVHCDDYNYFTDLLLLFGKYIDIKTVNECPRKIMGFKSGEGLEYCQAAHAERNAIAIAAKLGHSTNGCSMYLDWMIPCVECSKEIINSGIIEVVVRELKDYDKKGITGRQLLDQAGVKIREYNL